MKKAICFILSAVLLGIFCLSSGALTPAPTISAKSAILIDAESLEVLYQKNAFTKLPMASTTKIMTALIALESGDVNRQVKIDPRALGTEGSSVYLEKDETLSMRELVYALLLASANDAAVAIACEIAGSVEDFAVMMNQKAAELGLLSTHFVTPHGLHHEDHYTTAYDLSRLTAEALKNNLFLEICSSKSAAITVDRNKGTRYLSNHNKLLRSYEGCIGVKTGYTKASGRCLVSAAERDGLRLIAVTLNAPDDWRDHRELLDMGFENYTRRVIAEKGGFTKALPISAGKNDTLIVANATKMSALLPVEHGEITLVSEAVLPLVAPISRGDIIGRVVAYENGKKIAESPLVASFDVQRQKYKPEFFKKLKELLGF